MDHPARHRLVDGEAEVGELLQGAGIGKRVAAAQGELVAVGTALGPLALAAAPFAGSASEGLFGGLGVEVLPAAVGRERQRRLQAIGAQLQQHAQHQARLRGIERLAQERTCACIATIVELHQRLRQPGGAGQQPVQAIADRADAAHRTQAYARQAMRIQLAEPAMQDQAIQVHFQQARLGLGGATPVPECLRVGLGLFQQPFQRTSAQGAGGQQRAGAQARGQAGLPVLQQGRKDGLLQRMFLQPGAGHQQRLEVFAGFDLLGQA